MTDSKCELCEKSEDPNSQSKYGFKLSNRIVFGAPRRLLCTNCIAYLKRNKNIDFALAKLNRVGKKSKLAYSEPYLGQCECCETSEIEVKSRTFRRGEFRKNVCSSCVTHIHSHPEMSFDESKKNRLWRSKQIEKYRNSEFSLISEKDWVRVKIDGVWNKNKYECRKCGDLRIIRNPRYHLCVTCTNHEEYLGESCECCHRVSDGTYSMKGEFITKLGVTERLLLCMNCKKRILRYGVEFEELQALIEINNCQICEVELVEGKIGGKARCIDHDHRTGTVRGVICTSCNKAEGHIAKISDDYMQWSTMLLKYLKKEYEWDEIEIIKVEQYDEIKRYRNSKYSIIPEVERVPSKDANEGKTHICRRCNQMKKIKNTSYHFCDNCLQKEEFIGEICYCCNYVADGTKIMKKSNQSYMTRSNVPRIFCQDCYQKMMRFRISKYHLAKILKVTNCEICDLNLSLGKEAVNKDNAINIDHDHKTGRVRGVLCPNCNKAEGYIRNISQDPNIWAEKLQTYLLSREAPEN